VSLFKPSDKEAVGAGNTVFAVIAAVLALAALVTAAHANRKAESNASSAAATQATLTEFAITPSTVNAPLNGKLLVTNNGATTHNFTIDGTDLKTKDLAPGAAETLDLKGLKAASYIVYCNIAGHRQQGMQGTLVIGGSGNTSDSASGMANMDFNTMTPEQLSAMNDQMDANMAEAVSIYTAQLENGPNTKGLGNVPLKATVLPDGTKEFHLTAELADWQVDTTKTVRAWTFNGTVPGPMIKVNVGDKVRIVVTNKLPMSTGVHWHGLEVPFTQDGVPDVTQRPIKPGQKFTYEFTARGPMMAMYHSHHDAQVQVPNGMLGVFQVGNVALPAGTGPITQEVPMVLNDAGVIGLSLNGKAFPSTLPIMAKVGDWVQVDYYNEGLTVHPMHLHGIPQLVIAKDGYPLPAPYRADTILVAPGERYSVLIHPTAEFLGPNNTPGIWAFHCHILTHAEGPNGMLGMVTTFIVSPGP
jgi:uncharacterized cupredoxin-like copper-binding protein